jgi:hypothetical protein
MFSATQPDRTGTGQSQKSADANMNLMGFLTGGPLAGGDRQVFFFLRPVSMSEIVFGYKSTAGNFSELSRSFFLLFLLALKSITAARVVYDKMIAYLTIEHNAKRFSVFFKHIILEMSYQARPAISHVND